jgi:membrane protease YdiL (CAAX protease family)
MKWNWLAVLAAMVFPSLLAWFYMVALARPAAHAMPLDHQVNRVVVLAFGLGKLLQFAFPIAWVLLVQRRRLNLLIRPGRGLVTGICFGLAVAMLIGGVYVIFPRHWIPSQTLERLRVRVEEFGISTPASYAAFTFFLAVIHSFLEEYYWRWFVFGELRARLSLTMSLLLASAAFMAHHLLDLAVFLPGRFWAMAVPMSVAVGIGGAVWAWIYNQSGSLYGSWASHLLVDSAIMAVGYDLIFR